MDTLDFDTTDRNNLDEGLSVGAQGLAHRCSQRKLSIGSGERARILVLLRIDCFGYEGSPTLGSVVGIDGSAWVDLDEIESGGSYPPAVHIHGKARCG